VRGDIGYAVSAPPKSSGYVNAGALDMYMIVAFFCQVASSGCLTRTRASR
jgi:hypothetical protein